MWEGTRRAVGIKEKSMAPPQGRRWDMDEMRSVGKAAEDAEELYVHSHHVISSRHVH